MTKTLEGAAEREPAAQEPEGTPTGTKEVEVAVFDHSQFDRLMAKHVRFEAGRVDYAGLKKDEAALDAYLASIASAKLDAFDRNEAMALLINAYNGYTLKLILENYGKIKSIRDLDEPWDAVRYNVGGERVSLNNIEHNLLRPIYKDPRIHFAVNCASIGCPALAEFAYTGAKLEEQLELAMTRTVTNERYVQVKKGKLAVTKILEWYGDDFTNTSWNPRADTIPALLARYAEGPAKAALETAKTKLVFLEYSWSLNDISR